MTDAPALALDGVTQSFGGLTVLDDVSFGVRAGEATALIGPNGAGKTTVFNLVSGVYPPAAGRILAHGQDITAVPSRRRIRHGIARSFQNVRLMPHLTVAENLMIGQHVRASGLVDLLVPFRLIPGHRWRRELLDSLGEAGLDAHADAPVSALPYGIRNRVDLVRATLAGASLLMLDEPAAGLNPTETGELRAHLSLLKTRGVTLLIVEHDMQFVRDICDHVIVLNFGRKIAEGSFADIQRDATVRTAYLGSEEAA